MQVGAFGLISIKSGTACPPEIIAAATPKKCFMTHKHVLYRSEACEKVLRGADKLANAISVTLGPLSQSVLMESTYGSPTVCNDGITIAKAFALEDAEENPRSRMLRVAAKKTVEMMGAGTSSLTFLARSIFADGVRNVVADTNATDIKRVLDRATATAIEALLKLSKPISSALEKEQIATISAHNDESSRSASLYGDWSFPEQNRPFL